jgi:hypothetical protein
MALGVFGEKSCVNIALGIERNQNRSLRFRIVRAGNLRPGLTSHALGKPMARILLDRVSVLMIVYSLLEVPAANLGLSSHDQAKFRKTPEG